MPKPARKIDTTLIALLLITLLGFFLIHDLLGGTLLSHCEWDSYTLQAIAWREGRLGLGQNYTWLELASFGGDWYVSFPPVPTLVMLPLTMIFGDRTPNNLLMVIYALISVAIVYKCFRRRGTTDAQAAMWAAFAVLGSNLLWMSTSGGVWFQAQSLAFLLCSGAVLAALRSRRALSLALAALSVGCRPFTIFIIPALMVYFYCENRALGMSRARALLSQWKIIMLPALIGAAYLVFNYARFGNIFEFGHNYLPEFSEAEQFGLQYFPENLKNILRPIGFGEGLALQYPTFDGFLFFIANPFFIVYFVRTLRAAAQRRLTPAVVALLCALLLELVCLMLHKTFGGWQFGARYTVDLLPLCVMSVLLTGGLRPARWESALCAAAVIWNAYGALAMTFLNA